MAVNIDATAFSVVVYCDECVHWVVVANHKGEALVLAAKHENNVHPEQKQAQNRLNKSQSRAKQHAETKPTG